MRWGMVMLLLHGSHMNPDIAIACAHALLHKYRRHSMRQHTSAYASIRQHTSAYVSIRQTT